MNCTFFFRVVRPDLGKKPLSILGLPRKNPRYEPQSEDKWTGTVDKKYTNSTPEEEQWGHS